MAGRRRGNRGLGSNHIGESYGIEGVERFLAYVCVGWRMPYDITPAMISLMEEKLKENISTTTFVDVDNLLKRLNKSLWNICFIRQQLQEVDLPCVIGESPLKEAFSEIFRAKDFHSDAIFSAYIFAAKNHQLPGISLQKAKQVARAQEKKKEDQQSDLEKLASDLLSFTFSF